MAGPYDALIAGWTLSSASAGALPPGVTGTSLFGLNTAAKTAAVILWTVQGPIPPSAGVTGVQLANNIVWAEFKAQVQSNQTNILSLCNNPGPLFIGTASQSLLTAGMFLSYFGAASQTVKNIEALISGSTGLWWSAPVPIGAGITAPISQADAVVAAAGLT